MIRVLVVDDHELVRSGFRIILESEPGITVVGEAANGREAVELAGELAPDVICMDIEMPEMNGIEAARQILHGQDTTAGGAPAVLMLTTFGHEQYLFAALAAGVSGFLLKTARAEQLIDAVSSLAAGNALLGADVTRAVIEHVRGSQSSTGSNLDGEVSRADAVSAGSEDPQEPRVSGSASRADAAARKLAEVGLTVRETEVLRLVALGHSNAEIASQLFLGEATVKTHVSNMLQKLGVRDRIHAVVWAHTNDLF